MYVCIHSHKAQLARAQEYAKCMSAERKDPLLTSVLDMTRSNLMVRLQFWNLGEYGVHPQWHNFQVHSNLEWLYLIASHLWV